MAQVTLLAGQRQKGERLTAIHACNDWLRLGRGRSLPKLLERYTKAHEEAPPTRSLDTLKKWSSRYKWQDRSEEYGAELEQRKNERRKEVMDSGLALDFERVDQLKDLAHFLIDQLYEQGEDGDYHNVWLPDVKQIGSGKNAERVDIERFNAAIFSELRGVLDDLAKETGGRKQKHEVSGPEGGAVTVQYTGNVNPDDV
jgi:hypothetical protein